MMMLWPENWVVELGQRQEVNDDDRLKNIIKARYFQPKNVSAVLSLCESRSNDWKENSFLLQFMTCNFVSRANVHTLLIIKVKLLSPKKRAFNIDRLFSSKRFVKRWPGKERAVNIRRSFSSKMLFLKLQRNWKLICFVPMFLNMKDSWSWFTVGKVISMIHSPLRDSEKVFFSRISCYWCYIYHHPSPGRSSRDN